TPTANLSILTGTVKRRVSTQRPGVTSENKASCHSSRGRPGPQSKGADREAVCERKCRQPRTGRERGCRRTSEQTEVLWSCLGKFNPCQRLYALKAPVCRVSLRSLPASDHIHTGHALMRKIYYTSTYNTDIHNQT
ncbi:hypothetical protein ABVT39_007826, partial [Epinephelus coioides]